MQEADVLSAGQWVTFSVAMCVVGLLWVSKSVTEKLRSPRGWKS